MPLIQIKHISGFGKLGIWKIEEPASYFHERLLLSPTETIEFKKKKTGKEQWLACRWLVHIVLGNEYRLDWSKDISGKPSIPGSNWHFSISHSDEYCAVLASDQPVGIDIQKKVEKIVRVQSKFVSEAELQWIPNQRHWEHLHVIWGIKEAIYKMHGQKGLSFRRDIEVMPYVRELQRGWACTKKNDSMSIYPVFYEFWADYVLCGTTEK